MKDYNLFKILMTDTADRSLVDLMIVDGLPKLFPELADASLFCESLNMVAREEGATWRYEPSPLTEQEQAMMKAELKLIKEMF
jgi:hypothetical protein